MSAVRRLQLLHSGLQADFQALEGGKSGMESKKQGPHPRGTRQISKPGVRPGTGGLPSSRSGSLLRSRVLSEGLLIPSA